MMVPSFIWQGLKKAHMRIRYSVSEETESMLTWRKTWPTVEIVVRNISGIK